MDVERVSESREEADGVGHFFSHCAGAGRADNNERQ